MPRICSQIGSHDVILVISMRWRSGRSFYVTLSNSGSRVFTRVIILFEIKQTGLQNTSIVFWICKNKSDQNMKWKCSLVCSQFCKQVQRWIYGGCRHIFAIFLFPMYITIQYKCLLLWCNSSWAGFPAEKNPWHMSHDNGLDGSSRCTFLLHLILLQNGWHLGNRSCTLLHF